MGSPQRIKLIEKQQPKKLDKDIIRMFIKNEGLLSQLESGNDISSQISVEVTGSFEEREIKGGKFKTKKYR